MLIVKEAIFVAVYYYYGLGHSEWSASSFRPLNVDVSEGLPVRTHAVYYNIVGGTHARWGPYGGVYHIEKNVINLDIEYNYTPSTRIYKYPIYTPHNAPQVPYRPNF